MASYQVSYVVRGGGHPGAIRIERRRPRLGQRVRLGGVPFVVAEIQDLLPPREGVGFVHVTLERVEAGAPAASAGAGP